MTTPQEEGSPKRTCVIGDGASEEVTPFMRISDVFSSWHARTLNEVRFTISTSDIPFIQNISEGDKMELVCEITHSMYRDASLFSLVSTDRGDVLALGSPAKERETWKGKCETMESRCYTLQKKLVSL